MAITPLVGSSLSSGNVSGSSSASLLSMPTEIIEHVLDELDRHHFHSISLVCKTLRPLGQDHLFRTLILRSKRRMEQCVELFHVAPYLAHSVRTLYLELGRILSEEGLNEASQRAGWCSRPYIITQLLPLLPNVQELSIETLCWPATSVPLVAFLPALSKVELTCSDFQSMHDLAECLSYGRNLRQLRLNWVHLNCEELPSTSSAPRLTIHDLRLRHYQPATLDLIIAGLPDAVLHTLHVREETATAHGLRPKIAAMTRALERQGMSLRRFFTEIWPDVEQFCDTITSLAPGLQELGLIEPRVFATRREVIDNWRKRVAALLEFIVSGQLVLRDLRHLLVHASMAFSDVLPLLSDIFAARTAALASGRTFPRTLTFELMHQESPLLGTYTKMLKADLNLVEAQHPEVWTQFMYSEVKDFETTLYHPFPSSEMSEFPTSHTRPLLRYAVSKRSYLELINILF